MDFIELSPNDDLGATINNITRPTTVFLKKGVYRQKTEIRADDVTIVGEERETTVISYDDYARKIHSDGREYNTFRTYTLCVTGNRVKLENLTIENTNSDPREAGQCVALSVHGKLFKAKNVDLKSTQDTLFLSPFPDDLVVRYRDFLPQSQLYREGGNLHLFDSCRIFGTVDFIFGCAEAYFKDCEIISVFDGRDVGYVAAPAHSLAQENGFCFLNCDLKSGGAKDGTVFLARPWRDFGKCAFINCKTGGHVNGELFDKWNDTARDKTARFLYYNLVRDPEYSAGGKSPDPDCKNSGGERYAGAKLPVGWAKELTVAQAREIIEHAEEKFRDF